MRPRIFMITAFWDDEASVWAGRCDELPAAADAPTLDELFEKIRAMAEDLLPDNHPELALEDVFLQITALRSVVADAAWVMVPQFDRPKDGNPSSRTLCNRAM